MTEMEEIKTMLADINKKLDKVIFQNKIALNTKYGLPFKQEKRRRKTMTKNEQIDGIFGVIDLWASNAVRKRPDGDSVYNPYNAKELAVELYNAGYMKADEIHKETAEKIYTKIKDSFLMNSNNRYALKLWIEEQFGLEIKE